MKKSIPLFACILFAGIATCQNADSLQVFKTVDSLIEVSRQQSKLNEYDKALEVITSAENLARGANGIETATYGSICREYGNILYSSAPKEAEKWYLKALAVQKKILGPTHQDYAWTLYLLAGLCSDKGDFNRAEKLFLEAKKIWENIYGNESPGYSYLLGSLATVYVNTGEYQKAEQLNLEALKLDEKLHGKESAQYADVLNNLAIVYYYKGDYAKAEKLYFETINIYEKLLGKENEDYAMALNNLADMYVAKGEYSRAEPLFLEAKLITAKTLGTSHPFYANRLLNLVPVYLSKKEYDIAKPLISEALEIFANTSGKESSNYGWGLLTLAQWYSDQKLFDKAEPVLLEAKEIYQKTLGDDSPDYAIALSNLAELYQMTNRVAESTVLMLELNRIQRKLIESAMTYSSGNEMLAYLHTFEDEVAAFRSFVQVHPSPELLRENYNNTLFLNGLTLENERLLARAMEHADSLTRDIYEKWQSCHRRLAKRYARPIEEQKKISEVEAEAENYEKMLMRNLPDFQKTRKFPNWKEVQNELKAGEIAIEFIHYPFHSPAKTDSVQYAALLLRPGWEAPKMIPLFEEKTLDSLLNTHGERRSDYVSQLYSIADRGIVATEKPQKSLYELIFKPLEKELNEVQTVFFAPTGLLHRINLAAIPFNPDSTLADRYHLVELSSTRSLAVGTKAGPFITEPPTKNLDAMLFGGVQFEMDSTAIFAANARLNNADLASRGATEETSVETAARGGSWNYLKWTEKEVNAIAPILSAGGMTPELRKGFEATEEAFKSIGTHGPSPRILHLATHGFFFPDPGEAAHSGDSLYTRETGFKTSDNPLIRSGLLLAGANYAWKSGKPLKKGMENGILTAYEISHLNLINTELVVLSACETGLGDIQGNEGVYGLQRAFKIAGARYLIMSLWQVPDRETAEFMTTFYTHWLSDKKTIPEAFLATQMEMRERFINPYSWAGFVLVE